MSILVDKNTRLLVQGFTGSQATLHSEQSIEYGTNIVGGVTPGKGGQTHLGVPVFNSVHEAVEAVQPNASIIFVPAQFCKDSILEAADAGIKLILADPEVKVVLVNIFGGIVRCDLIAEGILAAIEEVGVSIPVVVRLEGNNADIGSNILAESSAEIVSLNSLEDAAKKAVELSK